MELFVENRSLFAGYQLLFAGNPSLFAATHPLFAAYVLLFATPNFLYTNKKSPAAAELHRHLFSQFFKQLQRFTVERWQVIRLTACHQLALANHNFLVDDFCPSIVHIGLDRFEAGCVATF